MYSLTSDWSGKLHKVSIGSILLVPYYIILIILSIVIILYLLFLYNFMLYAFNIHYIMFSPFGFLTNILLLYTNKIIFFTFFTGQFHIVVVVCF